MQQYLDLARHVRANGVFKGDRTGTGTYSVFGAQMRFDLRNHRLPILTTKKVNFDAIFEELKWFLSGDTNIRALKAAGVDIWDGNAIKQGKNQEYAPYTAAERAKKHCKSREQLVEFFDAMEAHVSAEEKEGWNKVPGIQQWVAPNIEEIGHQWLDEKKVKGGPQELVAADLGPVYGYQWRSWTSKVREPISVEERGRALIALLTQNGINPNDPEAARQFVMDYTLRDGFELPYWRNKTIDQITNVVNQLKTNPDDRRIIVSAWNPAEVDEAALPPCHAMFQFYSAPLKAEKILANIDNRRGVLEEVTAALKEKFGAEHGDAVLGVWATNHDDYGSYPFIDEMAGVEGADLIGQDRQMYLAMNAIVNEVCAKRRIPTRELSCQLYQRSADLFLGVPFNITSYALLTKMIAHVTGHEAGDFVWTGGDVHIYRNHLDQIDLQLTREPHPVPVLFIDEGVDDIFKFQRHHFDVVDYVHEPYIAAPMSA